MLIRDAEIPGYLEAVRRENDIRDAAFLDLTTSICGIEVRQLTPRDALILDGLDNPLMRGGIPTESQLAHFLWLLSPSYKHGSKVRRFLFARKVRNVKFIEATLACWSYVEDSFQDSPPQSSDRTCRFASGIAHLVDRMASQYGWTEEKILHSSFKKLFQYMKVMSARLDPDYCARNPSDKIRREGAIAIFNARKSLVDILKRRATN